MAFVILGLELIVGLVWLACFIMVIIKMFQNGDTGLAIACIVLFFCVLGGLIAFIMGWVKSSQYGVKNIMFAWTGAWVLLFILQAVSMAVLRP
jgi:hypothetical protein